MAKLTRKSYKRKKAAFAAILLGGVALVSSGFAAWVLSANIEKDATGNVTVGKVEDGALNMEIALKGATEEDSLNSGKFVFEPRKEDVQDDEGTQTVYSDGKNFENLSLTYSIKLTSERDSFKSFKVEMSETSEGNKMSTAAGDTKKYITLPECMANGGVVLTVPTFTASATEGSFTGLSEGSKDSVTNIKLTKNDSASPAFTWNFEYTVKFGWGDAFEGLNPGDYYDTDETGKKTDISVIKYTLNDLHGILDEAKFSLKFTAIAK